MPAPAGHKGRGRREPAQAYVHYSLPGSNRRFRGYDPLAGTISRMKGHEDGGIVLWTGGSIPKATSGAFRHDP
jgi:hypothetical protein